MNTVLLFKRALLMSISQTPARFNAKKWTTVGPKCEVGNICEIERDAAPARCVAVDEFAIRYVNKFKDERTGKLSPIERHVAAGKCYLLGLAGKKGPR